MPESGGLVRGGSGVIPLHQIPAARGRGFWSFASQQFEADSYEADHPEVTVRRPWESEEQHKARLAKRAITPLAEPELNMDPSRAEPELRRRQQELAGLETAHPQYEKIFASLVRQIHNLEGVLGRPKTRYQKGVVPRKESDPVAPELIEKFSKYKAQKEPLRRKSIDATEDLDFLALIAAQESVAELQLLAKQRIDVLMAPKDAAVK